MNVAATTRAVPAALRFILLSVLLNMLGAGLVIPVLPGLLQRFAMPAQHVALAYGAMLACYSFVQFFGAPWLGALSDRYGRRPLLLAGMAGLGLDFAAMAWAPSYAWLLGLRLLGGLSSSGGAVASAAIADLTGPAQRARAMGLLAAMTGLGFVVGPVLGGLLGAWHPLAPFLAAAALCMVNLGYGWRVLPETLPTERRRAWPWRELRPFAGLTVFWQNSALRRPAAIFALAQLAQMTVQSVWVLSNTQRFGWGSAMNGWSLFCAGVLSVLAQGVLLGRLLRVLGERRLLLLGFALAAVCQLLYAWAPQSWMMFAIMALGLPAYACVPLLQALISRHADGAEQGRAMGGLSALTAAAAVLAPLPGTWLLGLAAGRGSWQWPFMLTAGLLGLGLWLAWRASWLPESPSMPLVAARAMHDDGESRSPSP